MKLETLQTGLETLDKFKQDKSLANPEQEKIDNYVIGLQDNWAIDGATIGAELVEKAVDDSSELIFQSTPSSYLDSAQFRLENDGRLEGQRFENIAFFKAPGDKWSQPGGKGEDTFVFNSLDGSIDIIKDFDIAEGDRLQVSRSGFGASSRDDFRYDQNSGGFFFGKEQFAILTNKPSSSDVLSQFSLT